MLAAERDAALLFELARSRLDQARLPAPVCGVRLVAEQLPPFVPAARGLFDARAGQGEAWAALRERLRARLEPVLMPNDPIGQGHQTNPVPAAPAPLVGHIEDLSGQLRESCAALQDLERRLAL